MHKLQALEEIFEVVIVNARSLRISFAVGAQFVYLPRESLNTNVPAI